MIYLDIKETLHSSPKKDGVISAEINQIFQRSKLIILVEGRDDYILFKKFFKNSSSITIQPKGGCGPLQETISLVDNNLLIGIMDADFNRVFNNKINQRIFLTDCHDIEISMLENYEVITAINSEYETNIDINIIYEKLTPLTVLRFYQAITNKKIDFECVENTLNKIYTDDCLTIETLINKLGLQNEKNIIQDINSSQELIKNLKLSELCNGHDACAIIAADINIQKSKKNLNNEYNKQEKKKEKMHISKDVIHSSLRLSYSNSNFKSSALYNLIQNYLVKNNINDAFI